MIIMRLLGKPYHCIPSMLLLTVFVKPLLLVKLNEYVVMAKITKGRSHWSRQKRKSCLLWWQFTRVAMKIELEKKCFSKCPIQLFGALDSVTLPVKCYCQQEMLGFVARQRVYLNSLVDMKLGKKNLAVLVVEEIDENAGRGTSHWHK